LTSLSTSSRPTYWVNQLALQSLPKGHNDIHIAALNLLIDVHHLRYCRQDILANSLLRYEASDASDVGENEGSEEEEEDEEDEDDEDAAPVEGTDDTLDGIQQ